MLWGVVNRLRAHTRFWGYWSKFETEADWSADFWKSTGLLQLVPEKLQCYVDHAAYARDARLRGDVAFVANGYQNAWVFSNRM